MFNQKVNYYTAENPSYLNHSVSFPQVRAVDIHNCGTTINKYTKIDKCSEYQTWCSKNVAVESFAMRPIVSSKEYFDNISKYLTGIVLKDLPKLNASGLNKENYSLFNDYGYEPVNSFLQAINLEVTNELSVIFAASSEKISMFKDFNPLCEGFVLTDITINTYRSVNNENHFYHESVFSAVNTTRYNTVSFKAGIYQDTTPIMKNWNTAIKDVENSKDLPNNINKVNSILYVSKLSLLNDVMCVNGQETDCKVTGYNLDGSFSQLLNDNQLQNIVDNKWIKEPAAGDFTYNNYGNYDTSGNIHITDSLSYDVNKLVKDLKPIYTKYPYDAR
uniref:Uncharacterized protein n=1 Tax=viral metagenome TaxID=1070528 RepID=A0A6C0I965_9ZZZZ